MIAERFKELRVFLNKTQSEFSLMIGVNQTTISSIEKGKSSPNVEVAEKVVKTFPNVNSVWLLTGEGEMFLDNVIPLIPIAEAKEKAKFEQKAELKSEKSEIPNVSFLEKQIQWLQGVVDKLQRENELLIAKYQLFPDGGLYQKV